MHHDLLFCHTVSMDEFMVKYGGYGGGSYSVGEGCSRNAALGAFMSLLNGDNHYGNLFLMYPDELLRTYLLPEDFEF